MIFTLLITVLLTGIVLVVAAYAIAKLIGPRSYNPVKGEPFECGIPTYGSSWVPVHVGYYLFAILFLMFDVETVFLYPWATVFGQLSGEYGGAMLFSIGFFMLVLVFGLAYAWRKEHWNGNKKAQNQVHPLRGIQGQRDAGEAGTGAQRGWHQRHRRFPRPSHQLGPQQLAVVADLRHKLLRH